MAQKADYGLQSQRVVDAVRKMCSQCTVTFDNSRAPHCVKFRIDEGSVLLTKVHPEFHVSEISDWSGEKLSQVIEAVTGGLVGKSA